MKKISTLLLSLVFIGMASSALAQCGDSLMVRCDEFIKQNYISDGQSYSAMLTSGETAEFQTTLFGDNVYRIAACSGKEESNLIFRIYDQDKNLLFTNTEFGNSPYWDFSIEDTMVVTIEATLDPTRTSSGCAVLVIGFKR